jgi:hypothetical protein
MTISLIIVVPGVVLLLIAAFAGLATSQARRSQEHLVAPRNAGFGEATRSMRAEATRERARADLQALPSRKPDATLVMVDGAAKPADRRAA